MKHVLNIFVILFVMNSCNTDDVVSKPNTFLNKEDMISVIVDVQILESHYHNKFQRPNVYANALDSATLSIFKDHKITKQIFKENLTFYAINQDSLYNMYESALDTINNKINSNIVK